MDEAITMAKTGPLLARGPKLFVIDARNRVERKYLIDWLHTTLAEGGPDETLNWVALPISEERARIRYDELAEKLKDDPETLVVPVRIAWRIPNFEKSRALKKRHLIFGDPRNPGSLRARSILLRDKRRAHCLTGRPATIAELRQRFSDLSKEYDQTESTEFAAFVVRQAGLVLDIAERGLRGRRYKVPRHVADGLRSDPRFRSAISKLSEESGKSKAALYDEAAVYMKELIARPSPLFIDLKAKLERFILSQGYEDKIVVDQQDIEKLRRLSREKPVLLLFTHKTYIDGLTPTDIAYRNDLPMIHTFGGINMAFMGLGFLMRRAGGIFIRRSFSDNHLYKIVMRHYISYLLEKRFPMTWAFEGTRSRLGKLMPPRYGLLKYVVDSAYTNDIEDLHFVPMVTSFDLIRDVEEYAEEQTGRIKKPESLSWFIGYVRSLREPMGKVYVDFGEPVVVDKAPAPDNDLALSKIAFEVAVQANRATPLTFTALTCLSLLGSAPRALTADELRAILTFFVRWAIDRDIRVSEDLTQESLKGVQKVVETLVNNGLLMRYDQGSSTVYTIEPDQHPLASYYRNSIVHHFLDKAIIELSLLKAREDKARKASEVFWEETDRLRDLFKFEFFYPAKAEYRKNLKAELDRVDEDWKKKLDEGGPLLKSLTNRMQPLVGHAVFLPFVEAYTVVLDILYRLEPGQSIDKKECVELALKQGRQAYLLRRITSEASIGKILFENGFKMAAGLGLADETTDKLTTERKALLRKFRALSRRMEKSRLEVLALADKIFE